MTDLYKVLGIRRDASDSDIKKAFRKQSLQYHPDRNGDKSGQELEDITNKFKAANEAYEILSDSEKRQQYNMGGMDAVNGRTGGGGDPFQDMDQVFSMFFGGGMPSMPGFSGGGPNIRVFHSGGGGHPFGSGHPFQHFFRHIEKPQAIVKNIQITMQQSYTGITIPVEIEAINVQNNIQSTEIKSIQLSIPPGMNNNELMILENQGHNINDEVRGDIKIVILVENNTQFQREGMDLSYKKSITLKEALCGFSFEFQHLNDKNLCINNLVNHSVIKPGYKKVIPNLGFMRDGKIGSLIIEFDVSFPDQLSKDQIAELNDIL
jgi:DnaJ-class molecular chaperone